LASCESGITRTISNSSYDIGAKEDARLNAILLYTFEGLEIAMKRTIKGWCKQYGIDWNGQGNFGSVRYDWKLVLAPGRTAMFSSMIKTENPDIYNINKRSVLIFPNVNSKKNNGKISEAWFNDIISWVNEALDVNQTDAV
jgi:hypothetical protein